MQTTDVRPHAALPTASAVAVVQDAGRQPGVPALPPVGTEFGRRR